MLRKALSRVGWALLGMTALGALCVWLVYLQLLQLDGENRRELSRAAREIGTTLNELSATADRTLNVDGRDPSEGDLNGFAGELSQRNPYIVDREPRDFAPQQGRTTLLKTDQCRDHRSGLAIPRTIAVPARYDAARADGENKPGGPGKGTGSPDYAWKVYKLEATPERIFEDVFVSRAFEQLFIAYADGRVAFELTHGASAERRADRGWLVQRSEGDSGRGRSTTRIENLRALETAPGIALNLDVVAAASGSHRIYLGDRAYQLYAYPIRIATFEERFADTNRNCAEEAIWIVAGIVDPQRMQEEAFTISPQWMLLVFLAFATMVVGQPFVKLFLLKPTERFRSSDAWLLLPSASVLLTMATILVLDIGAYGRLTSRASANLKDLAQEVESSFGRELRRMHGELVKFDEQVAKAQPDALRQICNGTPPDVMNLLAEQDSAIALEAGTLPLPRPTYPSTIQVFWLDPSGRQIFKVSVVQRGTGRQTVADREYFTEVRDGRLWSFREGPERQFFTQSLRSITTAELLTALSIPSSLSGKCVFENSTDRNVVAVITGVHPTSVERPVLPSGYSFAIVGASGAVLYHSDRRRILKENLFEEFDDPERLQAAVHAGTPQHFRTTYARRPTEVFITPFTGIPAAKWFITTLRDEQWLETVNSEVLLRATFWSVAASAPIFVVAIPLLFAGKRWLPYLWPDATKESFYELMAPVYVFVLLAGLVASVALDGALLFWASAGFPLFVIAISGASHLIWTRRRRRAAFAWVPSRAIFRWGRLNELNHQHWYFLTVAALWACTAVVPATGMLRYAWDLELAKFRSLEWNRIEQQNKAWEAQDASEWKHVNIGAPPAFLESRQDYLDFYVHRSAVMPVERPRFEQWLDNHLPLYNEVAERLRDQRPVVPEDPASSSEQDLLSADVAGTWQTLVGGVLVALIAWRWLRYKDRHLLWSHLPNAPPAPDFARLASERRLLVIVTPSERARARLTKTFTTSAVTQARIEPSALATIGIAPSALTDNVLDRLGQIASTTYGAQPAPDAIGTLKVDATIDDFEQDMLRPDTRLTNLKKIEACVANNGRAVIVSRADPLRFLSPASGVPGESGDVGQSLPPAERERWLAALEPFSVHSAAVEDVDENGMQLSENHELYFDSLWRHCSPSEKLTLVQVAEEGFANPHQERVVRGLIDKRLLKLNPNLQLRNAAFEKFVVQQARSAQVTAWERPEGALGWQGIRWILAFLVLAVLLFLATTQGAWFNSAAAMLGGIAVGLEAVSGLLHAFNRSRQLLA